MARGWESKSVESQREDAEAQPSRRPETTPADLARARKRESLELSRRRITNELQTSGSEVLRTALKNALDHLDSELRKLEQEKSSAPTEPG